MRRPCVQRRRLSKMVKWSVVLGSLALPIAGMSHISPKVEPVAISFGSRSEGGSLRGAPVTQSTAMRPVVVPRGVYVVIDTANNRLYLKRGERTIYTAIASTGSGAVLVDPLDSSRRWMFHTPRGVFSITSKLSDPVWIKPDWAFIEEGQPLPTRTKDRIEAGVLGDYALGFGNGYFIHGTLYTRLLGTNVTHGCIRLKDEDLHHVFQTVPVGATVIIF